MRAANLTRPARTRLSRAANHPLDRREVLSRPDLALTSAAKRSLVFTRGHTGLSVDARYALLASEVRMPPGDARCKLDAHHSFPRLRLERTNPRLCLVLMRD